MSLRTKTRRNNERGVAMILALLSLLLLAIIGLGFMFMADTENSVNNNYKDAQKAYFASRAGLENVRLLLAPPNPVTGAGAGPLYNQVSALTMPTIAAPSGVIYVENPSGAGDNIDPTDGLGDAANTPALNPTLDDELCHEQFPLLALTNSGASAPCLGTAGNQVMRPAENYFQLPNPALPANAIPNTNTASALPFKWVRITNKQNLMGLTGQQIDASPAGSQVCWTGSQEIAVAPGGCAGANANPVWLLTSLSVTPGVGNNQGSRRFTQMEVAITPPIMAPSPISTQAPVNLHGSYQLQSYDNCSCTSVTNNGNTVYGVSRPGKVCYNQAHTIYTAGTVSTQGSSGTVISNFGGDAQTSSQQNVNPWPSNLDVNKLINQYKSSGVNAGTTAPYNYNCTGTPNLTANPPQYASCGTQTGQGFGGYPTGLPDNPSFPSGNPGPQTTYIPGSVKLTANASGSGIIIVDGDLEISGGLNFYGLLLVRGQVSFTGGGSSAVNLYGAILAGKDVLANDTSVSDDFGGSVNFKYDRCALARTSPPGPPTLIATHELMY